MLNDQSKMIEIERQRERSQVPKSQVNTEAGHVSFGLTTEGLSLGQKKQCRGRPDDKNGGEACKTTTDLTAVNIVCAWHESIRSKASMKAGRRKSSPTKFFMLLIGRDREITGKGEGEGMDMTIHCHYATVGVDERGAVGGVWCGE